MALSDKRCSRPSQGASLFPSCPQFLISCWQHTLQGFFLCHLSGYEEEGSTLVRAELGSSPVIIKVEAPEMGTMGSLDGGPKLLLGSETSGLPRPKVGSSSLRVRQAARPGNVAKEGLPSTGRTPVV